MITNAINSAKRKVTNLLNNFSPTTQKETLRFIIAFLLAWFFKTLLNEIPFFTQLFHTSKIDLWVQNILIKITQFLLESIGYETYSQGKFIQIVNTFGIRYEFGCLGFRQFTLFIVFIMAYFGRLINKLWFIPLGCTIIMLVNAIRGSAICIAQLKIPNHFIQVHDILSPWLMYSTILALWIIWVVYFGKAKKEIIRL